MAILNGATGDEKVPMTVIGKKLLEDELKRLMQVERPLIVKAIEVAREHGDLSENADYTAAKERQGFIESRIKMIGDKLARSQVIDPSTISSNKVVFGATVLLEEQESGKKVTYQVVGVDEADIKIGKIAVTSPLARAMIGKGPGEEIIVLAPKGKIAYEIIQLKYT
jgi:transcription elongation factor GreA